MNSPVFSIIVPVYNTAQYLEQCFDSITKQSFEDFEVVIIDDGSSDGSEIICDQYCKKDSRFTVFHQNNQGSSSARNQGLALCKGDLICFIDADDWVEPSFLYNFYDCIQENDADVVISAFYYDKDNEEAYFPNKPSKLDGRTVIKESLDRTLHSGLVFKAIKKELIFNNNLRFPRQNYFEDMFFNCALMHYVQSICYCPVATYHYRFNPSSQTNIQDTEKRVSLYSEFCENMESLFDKYQMWNEPLFYKALYKEVNIQKLRLIKESYGIPARTAIRRTFKDSANFYPIHTLSDCFNYAAIKTCRRWPIIILEGLHRIKDFYITAVSK